MNINHDYAMQLEEIVCRAHSCESGGMGGYIHAARFRDDPFSAAEYALNPLWKNADSSTIGDFMYHWEQEFRYAHNNDVDIKRYINDLSDLVDSLINQ